jgi:hypothetical protein
MQGGLRQQGQRVGFLLRPGRGLRGRISCRQSLDAARETPYEKRRATEEPWPGPRRQRRRKEIGGRLGQPLILPIIRGD